MAPVTAPIATLRTRFIDIFSTIPGKFPNECRMLEQAHAGDKEFLRIDLMSHVEVRRRANLAAVDASRFKAIEASRQGNSRHGQALAFDTATRTAGLRCRRGTCQQFH
jgi:hypothetical protein